MKLKCDKHGRRVLTVPTSPSFLHRTGDLSKCNSKMAVLIDNRSKTTRSFTVNEIGDLVPISTTKS